MIPARIEGCTRALGAPVGWNPEKSGICGVLPIRDEMNGDMPAMVSAWEPTPDELTVLAAGGKVYLRVLGQGHPPVWVYALGPGDSDISFLANFRELLAAARKVNADARPTNWDDEDQPGEPGHEQANAWRALDAALAQLAGEA